MSSSWQLKTYSRFHGLPTKEFGRLMKERDKELEDNDVYRRKIWHESLDMINTNLSNMLGCIYELESIVNKVG